MRTASFANSDGWSGGNGPTLIQRAAPFEEWLTPGMSTPASPMSATSMMSGLIRMRMR